MSRVKSWPVVVRIALLAGVALAAGLFPASTRVRAQQA